MTYTADEAAARVIAEEMKANAGQQGAVRVAARHFGDQLESRHYPGNPMDGVRPGAQIAAGIGGSLAMYEKAVKGYLMDEKVTLDGDTITITSFTSGTHSDGTEFKDVSLVAYQVKNGKIARADAVHSNLGAIMKAMSGSDDKAAADHLSADKIATEMRASGGRGLEIAQKYFSEKVAAWSPDNLEKSALRRCDELRARIESEMAALGKALKGYENQEKIKVQGNTIFLDGRITGKLGDGESIWGDMKVALSVSDDMIVGIESSHSEQGRANLRKILAASGLQT